MRYLWTNALLVDKCPLCSRLIEHPKDANRHHLKPLSRGGKNGDVVRLHRICHQKIHSVFTEKELEQKFNTIEALLKTREMKKFVNWVQKKPSNFYDKNHQSKVKKAKNNDRKR
jgi:hypothetical protein